MLEPGLFTLVVDGGRPDSRGLGVPVGGAADRFALAIGNALVGNPPETAALEITLQGPTLQTDADMGCVVYGAPFEVSIERRPVISGRTLTLRAGEVLRLGSAIEGMRAYLCVFGGFQTPFVLGSQSGFEPLRAGMQLHFVPGILERRFIRDAFAWNLEPMLLHVLDGPQADWFPTDCLFEQEYKVSSSSNRMGLRLLSGPLPLPARELLSEPVAPGAVQVARDGQCIILGMDGQTIGGYPKIAHVISADLDKLAQLRPGEGVLFQRVSLEEAETLLLSKQAELRQWLARLGLA